MHRGGGRTSPSTPRGASLHPATAAMKWIFALNENSPGLRDYSNLLQVAVASARRHTALEPVFIFDGAECGLTRWMRDEGVEVVLRRSSLLAAVPDMGAIARGAYLRFEIPALAAERGWSDAHVLYTDCDVLFQADPAPVLAALQPRVVAVAPEYDRADLARFNSGVMWINVAAFGAALPALQATVKELLPDSMESPYDQLVLQRCLADRVDRLPDELNWKPYWGPNPAATIVHFHGPKPQERYALLNRTAPVAMVNLGTRAFFDWASAWDRELVEVLERHPVEADPPDEPIAFGFEGFADVAGLSDEQGPYPQWYLPVIRWGLAPRTVVAFTAPEAGVWRLEFDYQCPYPDQRFQVYLDNLLLDSVAITRVSRPRSLIFESAVAAGRHEVRLEYAHGFPRNEDPRPLAVLFRAIRFAPKPAR
jgi:hypothetical protein